MKYSYITVSSPPSNANKSKAIWPGSGTFRAGSRQIIPIACLRHDSNDADHNFRPCAAISDFEFGQEILKGLQMLDKCLSGEK